MPRRIIGSAFLSLDGVMQAPGGPDEDRSGGFELGGWLANHSDDAVESQVSSLFAGPFDLLLGRRTYDIFAAYWPYQPMENPIAAKFAEAGKFVLTSSEAPLSWRGSTRLAGIDAVAALKESDGPELVIQGSSTLYPQLLAHGLLDRLVTITAPVTIGRGKRLFGEGTPPGAFRALEHRIGANGCAVSTFVPDGSVRPGTFASEEPSAEEMQRRAKIAAGDW